MRNTNYKVKQILEAIGGLPEECDWIDYKAVKKNFDKEFKGKIKTLILSFLNSVVEFGNSKYIIFGIEEDKKTKKKRLVGLNDFKFPDDNEWQNLVDDIKPNHPYIESGTIDYKGLLFGYIYINADNYNGPYYYMKDGKEIHYIRRGGNKYDNINEAELAQLNDKINQIRRYGKIYPKSDILRLLVFLGQYNESNKADISFIEKITRKKYANILEHYLSLDRSFSDTEKSIYGLGNSRTVKVNNKHERLQQLTADELHSAKDIILGVYSSDSFYSEELLSGIADTLVFLSNSGFHSITVDIVKTTVSFDTIRNNDLMYRNTFQQLAEAAPKYFFDLLVEHKHEVLQLKLVSRRLVIRILRVIAWYPEFYHEATGFLQELKDENIYELFMPSEFTTAASYDQKINLIKEIVDKEKDTAFKILSKVLYFNPKMNTILSESYVPQVFKRLFERPHSSNHIHLQELYKLLLDCAEGCSDRLLDLLPHWLQPFPFSNLYLLAEHLEKVEPTILSVSDRQAIWNRLCNTPLVYITDAPVEESIKYSLISIGKKFKPSDAWSLYQRWFRKNIQNDMCIGDKDYDAVRQQIFNEQKNILMAIYKDDGVDGMISFLGGDLIEIDAHRLSEILNSSEFSLTFEDDNTLISAFVENPKMYSGYFSEKSFRNRVEWIKKLDLSSLPSDNLIHFFAALYPRLENIKYFEFVLADEKIKYWKEIKLYCDDSAVLQYAFKQFIDLEIPEKAFDILSNINHIKKSTLDVDWLFDALMKQREFPKCYIDKYVFGSIYHWLLHKIDDNRLEQIEQLSFNLYGKIQYHYVDEKLRPIITFKRIVNESEYFVEMAKCAIANPYEICEHLLKSCNEIPSKPNEWVSEIENLITGEDASIKKKLEYMSGYLLYNCLKRDSNGDYEIEMKTAVLLEQSEVMREGFFNKAYLPNGFHGNGTFDTDSNDRMESKRFMEFAAKQKEDGHFEFSKLLQRIGESLVCGINSMETLT